MLASGVHSYPTSSSSRFLYIADALRLAKKLPKPDVVSAQDPFETGLAAWLIARRFRAPLHVQVHTDFLSPEFARHSLLNRLRILIARFVLKRASGIRVVSERIRHSLEARSSPVRRILGTGGKLNAHVTVLPIFVDIGRFNTPKKDRALESRFMHFKQKILVVSRLEREKNVSLALEAFTKSAPSEACLIIVGEGSERGWLEKKARKRGIAGRVFFEGAQDPAPYYALADLILFPSRYDGYGMVIIEALAAGKPVLATDVGVAREAGAIIAERHQFSGALLAWFKNGPRTAELLDYPYKDFGEYVRAYCADITACTK